MKSIHRLGSLLGVMLLALLAPSSGAAPATHLDKLRLLPPVLIKGETGWAIDERMRRYKVEAVSVAVVKDFRVIWTEARGFADREARVPATTQTLFQAGSISKPVAAAGILRRIEKGELALDRDVNEYLKSWKLPENELTAKRKVTLELILSHSAGTTVHGFPGYAAGEPPVPTVPQVLDGVSPANTDAVRVDLEPSTKFRYSGGGITIAQLVQTDTTGRPFPDLLRELVLQPAGMTHSTYEQPLSPEKLRLAAAGYRADGSLLPGKRHTYPEMAAAGLWTTSEDLARFGIAVARSLRGEKGSLLSKKMAMRMTTPFLKDGPGLGFFIQMKGSDVYFGHDGSDEGFQALLQMHRDKGYGAAIMANSDRGIALGQEILRGIAREYGWEEFLPDPLTTVKLAAGDLAPLAGRYRINGDDVLDLTVRGRRLFGKRPFEEEFELFAISRDGLVRKDREIRYRVERSNDGVSAVETTFEKERITARRMPQSERIPSDFLAEGDLPGARSDRVHADLRRQPVGPGGRGAAHQPARLSPCGQGRVRDGDRCARAQHRTSPDVVQYVRQPRRGLSHERRSRESARDVLEGPRGSSCRYEDGSSSQGPPAAECRSEDQRAVPVKASDANISAARRRVAGIVEQLRALQ